MQQFGKVYENAPRFMPYKYGVFKARLPFYYPWIKTKKNQFVTWDKLTNFSF